MSGYLSLREAAARLGVHHTTLARAVRRGALTPDAHTPGGRPRFTVEAVARYGRSLGPGGHGPPGRERRALASAADLFAAELDPREVLRRLPAEARRLVGARSAAAALLDAGRVTSVFVSGLAPQERRAATMIEGGERLDALFCRSVAVPVNALPGPGAPASLHRGVEPGHGTDGGSSQEARLYLGEKAGGGAYTDEDGRLLEELARHAAIALRNARRFEVATAEARRWQALSRIARQVSASLDVQGVLEQVVRETRDLLHTDASYVALLEERGTRLRIAAWRGLRTRGMRSLRFSRDRGVGGAVLEAGGPLVVEDYMADPRLKAPMYEEVRREGLVSHLAVPLEARGQQLGVLYAGTRLRRAFTREEVDLAVQVAGLVALAVDNARLFERERAARVAAAAAEARLRTVLNHLPEGVFAVDTEGRVTLANRTAARIVLGSSRRRLQGIQRPFGLQVFYPDGRPMPDGETPIAVCLAGKGPCLGREMVVQRQDGTRIPLLINSAPLTDAQGRITGVVVVQQDISRFKEVEQMKNDFLSMITHDLKSPLTTIKGTATSMLMEADGGAVAAPREWAEAIDAEADRLTELVNNLLDMSRIEAGAMPLDKEECYPVDLVAEAVRRFQHTGGHDDHAIRTDVPADLPPVFADYNQLQRVLTNLLSNAAKYSEAGVPIRVRAHLDPRGGWLLCEVRDRGIGIPRRDRERIFEKFYRSPHQLGGRRQGSGLGLAICRSIIDAHGGAIWARSRPGGGSTFTFKLPLDGMG